jgi:hypothetical protein
LSLPFAFTIASYLFLPQKNVISTEAAHSLIVSSAAEKSAVVVACSFLLLTSEQW